MIILILYKASVYTNELQTNKTQGGFMITFVPSWKHVSFAELSTDDFIGPIQATQTSGLPYQILVSEYMPRLRYFMHRFGLLETPFTSLFDHLQGFEGQDQRAVALQDLDFPEEVYYVYSPFNILAYMGTEMIGKIYMAEGSFISEVQHFNQGELSTVDIYDDRGMLSSRKIYENGAHRFTDYLDQAGERVFSHFEITNDCSVNLENKHGLKQDYYPSLEALIFERREDYFETHETENILFALNAENEKMAHQSSFLPQMVFSYFSSRYVPSHLLLKIEECRGILVDSEPLQIYLRGVTKQRIEKISPFDTRFTLSRSQEVREEVLYLEVRHLPVEETHQLITMVFDYICVCLKEEPKRRFQLIARCIPSMQNGLDKFFQKLVSSTFPEEVELLKFLEVNQSGENKLELTLSGELKERLEAVETLLESFEAVVITKDAALFKALNTARLLIDLSEEPDLFTQIAGISAGIPQINSQVTEYVCHQKNGQVLIDIAELKEALPYYLDSLKHWQQARIHSVQQIKRYSGPVLLERLLKLFERSNDGG